MEIMVVICSCFTPEISTILIMTILTVLLLIGKPEKKKYNTRMLLCK